MLRTILRQSRPSLLSSSRYSTSTSPSSPCTAPAPPPPPSPSSEEPPRISYLSLQTLYPFLLLSIITSLALNLSHNRNNTQAEQQTLRAQISVLETIVQRIRSREENAAVDSKGKGKALLPLTEIEQEGIERELELVGLGRAKLLAATPPPGGGGGGAQIGGKGKEVANEVGTTWREVFLGKKGKEWEEDKDETDWEKVFKDASDADERRSSQAVSLSPTSKLPAPSTTTEPTLVFTATALPPPTPAQVPRVRSAKAAVYL